MNPGVLSACFPFTRVSYVAVASNLLWIKVQMCSVNLIEPPKEIFGRPVHIIATRVVWEVVSER